MRCFCSSVPNSAIGCRLNTGPWMLEAAAMPPPDSATACIMIAASVMPSPAPPTSSGMAMPSQPASAIDMWKSCGKTPSRSRSSQYSSGKLRAVLQNGVANVLLVLRER